MARPWPISAGFSLCVGGALALAFACNAGDLTLPASSEPAAVTGLQGNSQTAIVGGTLPESLVVRVTDTRQLPIPQIRVAFVLMTPTAGGSITPDTGTTDQAGRVAARWTLGRQAGPQQAEARIVGNDQLNAAFTATASAGAVASFVIVKGDKQRAQQYVLVEAGDQRPLRIAHDDRGERRCRTSSTRRSRRRRYATVDKMNFEAPLTSLVWLTSIVSVVAHVHRVVRAHPGPRRRLALVEAVDRHHLRHAGGRDHSGVREGLHVDRVASRARGGQLVPVRAAPRSTSCRAWWPATSARSGSASPC